MIGLFDTDAEVLSKYKEGSWLHNTDWLEWNYVANSIPQLKVANSTIYKYQSFKCKGHKLFRSKGYATIDVDKLFPRYS